MSEFQRLADTLYGAKGIGATDIKFFPMGESDASIEEISRSVRLAIEDIQSGGGKPVDLTI